jgi:hypothetical protein
LIRDVVLREEYPDGAAREQLACGHVIYLTKRERELPGVRRCLLCIRRGATNGKRPKR